MTLQKFYDPPDLHFYNTIIQNLNTPYILPEDLQSFLGDDKDDNVGNSNYELLNYVSVHQIRNHYKGSGVSVYIHKNFEFKIRHDVSINSKDIESISAELLYEKTRNNLFHVVYRSPKDKKEPFKNFLKILFNKNRNSNKNYHIAGDFTLNLLDHNKN